MVREKLFGAFLTFGAALALLALGCNREAGRIEEIVETRKEKLPTMETRAEGGTDGEASNSRVLSDQNVSDKVENSAEGPLSDRIWDDFEESVPPGTGIWTPSGDELDLALVDDDLMLVPEEDHTGLQPAENLSESLEQVSGSESTDEVVVDLATVTLRECVVRGILRNKSDKLFARDVVLTLEHEDGKESVSWSWPLTMSPGDSAPFEVEITWPPEAQFSDSVEYSDAEQTLGSVGTRHLENTRFMVSTSFSTEVDLSQSFSFDLVKSDFQQSDRGLRSMVYDDRVFEVGAFDYWLAADNREVILISKPEFRRIYPDFLIKSDDLDSFASTYVDHYKSDVYYDPARRFPDEIDNEKIYTVDNVKVYQAIYAWNWETEVAKVLDVRELIPYTIDGDPMQDERTPQTAVIPAGTSVSSYPSTTVPFYVLMKRPTDYSTVYFESAYSDTRPYGFGLRFGASIDPIHDENVEIRSNLWIGQGSESDPFGSSNVLEKENEQQQSGQVRGSCDREGPLTLFEREFPYGAGYPKVLTLLGNFGIFDRVEPLIGTADGVVVEPNSITLKDGMLRGLVRNNSQHEFARDVVVKTLPLAPNCDSHSYEWPLTVQPSERAPFIIANVADTCAIEDFMFEVDFSFSEYVDVTRSFYIAKYRRGHVFGGAAIGEQESADYCCVCPPLNLSVSGQELLTSEEFSNIYSDISTVTFEGELAFIPFVDLHARLEYSYSHPSLERYTLKQRFDNLKAYAAIFDSELRVLDIKELIPFSVLYGPYQSSTTLVPVDSIPTPNTWSPNSLRLLLMLSEMELGECRDYPSEIPKFYYHVWIGEAAEPERG